MTSNAIFKFKEQCARKITYKSDCPEEMRIQCIQEKFDGDSVAYRHWAKICKDQRIEEEKQSKEISKNLLHLKRKSMKDDGSKQEKKKKFKQTLIQPLEKPLEKPETKAGDDDDSDFDLDFFRDLNREEF